MTRYDSRPGAAPTVIILCGLALIGLFLPSESVVETFGFAAVGVGLLLGVATAVEAKSGVRSLIRVDLLMLWVLYGLTFLEFLFPQPGVESAISPITAADGTYAVLLGFAGIAAGRHLVPRRRRIQLQLEFQPRHIFALFLVAALLGYLHMLIAVNFDIIEMLQQMAAPRFSQPWSRGRYGDIYSLLYELGMLIYLLPPLAGLVCARKHEYSAFQKITVTVILFLTFYYAFASGTRSVMMTYAIAFAGTYFLTKPDISVRSLVLVGVPSTLLLLAVTAVMLEFRSEGVGTLFTQELSKERVQRETLFIDQNMVNLSRLTQAFSESSAFLGFEIPYQALIKPIPRALWPGKPEGLSTSIEGALGVVGDTMTLSCTFIGESYMAAGFLGVLLAGLFFGAGAEMWNRVGRDNSTFSQVLYASGFLCAAIAMRSLLTMVPLMLPSLALWLYGKCFLSRATLRSPQRVGQTHVEKRR